MKRRSFCSAGALAAAAAASENLLAGTARAAPVSGIEKTKIAIAVGGKPAFYYLPLTIAEQLGYFKEEGLDVEISDFAGGAKALQALIGGSADVVSGAYEHTIAMQAKRQYISAFVLQGVTMQVALGYSPKRLPNYKSVADLKGAKIGVTAPGSSTNTTVNLVLAKAGMKPSDVSIIGVGAGSGAIAALRSGQIDAISNIDPVISMLERDGEIRLIADTRSPKGNQELLGGPCPAGCLYAQEAWIKRHPNTTQALSNAMVKALRWLQTAGPSDLIRTVPESYLLGDRAVYLDAYRNVRPALSTDGLMPAHGPETVLKLQRDSNPEIAAASIDLSRTYTMEFARKSQTMIKSA